MLEGKLSVVIPVYNEERTIASIVQILLSWGKAREIIVVNDGSTDRTFKALAQFKKDIKLISRRENRGKGYSLAEGVRASGGQLLMFMDGDVVGLTHRDLDKMVNPVLRGAADMLIAVTNCTRIGTLAPFDSINGERVLWKKNIIGHLAKFHHVGNGVEFVINDLHQNKRVKTIKLPHVYILSKVEKAAVPEAMLGYIKEVGQFLKAIVQIQTDELTPKTRKIFRIAQSYLRRALDYLQA
ncbi:MAG: glycosyltransferase family 2 protein [Patescibacteria group bacterium]